LVIHAKRSAAWKLQTTVTSQPVAGRQYSMSWAPSPFAVNEGDFISGGAGDARTGFSSGYALAYLSFFPISLTMPSHFEQVDTCASSNHVPICNTVHFTVQLYNR
jgi:hypothetical protein